MCAQSSCTGCGAASKKHRNELTHTLTLLIVRYFVPWTWSPPFSDSKEDTESSNPQRARDTEIYGQKRNSHEEPGSSETLRVWKADKAECRGE